MKYKYLNVKRLLVVIAMVSASEVYAQIPAEVTTTAVPFLEITPDARAGGMGNMGLATSTDADAMFHNLAKTVLSEEKAGVSVNYTPCLRNVTSGISYSSLAGYYKLDNEQAVSASLRYFSIGDVPVMNYSGAKLGVYKPNEFAFDLGYSRKLSGKFSVGMAFRYIYSKLADGTAEGTNYKAGNAFAADISAYYNGLNTKGEGWTGGVAVTNLGTKIGYTSNSDEKAFIPATAGIGGAYTMKLEGDQKITFGLEAKKLLVPSVPLYEEAMKEYYNTSVISSWVQSFSNTAYCLGAGAEYSYADLLKLRAGYTFDGDDVGNSKYITTGLGLKYNGFELNFAYLIPSGSRAQSPMANTLRFGLMYHINK